MDAPPTERYPRHGIGLAHYAEEGDVAEVKRQLAAGADPTVFNGGGAGVSNPLIAAVMRGRWEVVEVLLAAGADPDTDAHGFPCVGQAAGRRHAETVAVLARGGADVNRLGKGGVSPLIMACSMGCLEEARVLLDAGARTDFTFRTGLRAVDMVRVGWVGGMEGGGDGFGQRHGALPLRVRR
jgi:uncharacterized protein